MLPKQPLGLPLGLPQQEERLSKVAGLPALQSLSAYGPIQTSDLPDTAEVLAIFETRLNKKLHQLSVGCSLSSAVAALAPGDLMALLFLVKDPPAALSELQHQGKTFMVDNAPGVCTDCGHFLAEITPTIRKALKLSSGTDLRHVHIIEGSFAANCPGPTVCSTCVVYTGIANSIKGFPATDMLFELDQPSGQAKLRQVDPDALGHLADLVQGTSQKLMNSYMHANCGLAIHPNLTEELPLLEMPQNCYPAFLSASALQHPIVWNCALESIPSNLQTPRGRPSDKRKYDGDGNEQNRYPRQQAPPWIPQNEKNRSAGSEKGAYKGKGKGAYHGDTNRHNSRSHDRNYRGRSSSWDRQGGPLRSDSHDRPQADPHRQPYRQEDTVPAIAERQPQANQHRSDRSDSRQPYREKDTVPVIASNNVYAAFYKALDNQ